MFINVLANIPKGRKAKFCVEKMCSGSMIMPQRVVDAYSCHNAM